MNLDIDRVLNRLIESDEIIEVSSAEEALRTVEKLGATEVYVAAYSGCGDRVSGATLSVHSEGDQLLLRREVDAMLSRSVGGRLTIEKTQ